jgi:hypothetical protein
MMPTGTIESISPKAVALVDLAGGHLIQQMKPHADKYAFIADVAVETVNGLPVLYKLINYVGAVEKP